MSKEVGAGGKFDNFLDSVLHIIYQKIIKYSIENYVLLF